ncbi:hypothetical protein FSARC_12514 [Fusarium sarcochroum]|uniref:Uncharacterized protein n=1 Tax=Fusarium sarcochroum TaxID=1208366 RepID=A0A8H4T7U4_9HYPO|nr:hypothetical protein FSARC_12514 [Fusarium sarcochroum]
MCWMSRFLTRCQGCHEVLENTIRVDRQCTGKKRHNSCNILPAISDNVSWVDPSNCLVCLAQDDILGAQREELKVRQEAARARQEAQEAKEAEERADKAAAEEEEQMKKEKNDRVFSWIQDAE